MGALGRGATARNIACILCSWLLLPCLALGQSVEGRFFTPKGTYLVGEPIFVNFEFANNSHKPVWVDSRFGQPCFGRENITVVGAQRAWQGWIMALGCYGGWAGSCLGGVTEIKPGQTHSERIFVNHYYQLDQPGTYEVRIARTVTTYNQGRFSDSGSPIKATADFDIQLVQGTEEELKAVFQPVLKDLVNTNNERRWQAIQVVTELAQTFLEQTVINLSKSPEDVSAAIEGLYKLNTPQARERLAELTEQGKMEATRENAMQSLAALGDKHYLPLFFRLARCLKGGEQGVAIESAGLLGGSQAVPFLSSLLDSHDPAARMAAIRGLAGTASRSAVSPVILEIRDPDPNVRQIAGAALAQLTHLSTADNALASVPNPALTFEKWHDWWLANGFRAPIYGPTDCAEPKRLK